MNTFQIFLVCVFVWASVDNICDAIKSKNN